MRIAVLRPRGWIELIAAQSKTALQSLVWYVHRFGGFEPKYANLIAGMCVALTKDIKEGEVNG